MAAGKIAEAFTILERASSLGMRQLDDGTRLIGKVTHVAPEAWFHLIFSPLTEKDVKTLEQILRRQLPKCFREFLMDFANGLNIFSGSLSLDGLRKNYVRGGEQIWQPFALETPNLYERPKDAGLHHFFIGGYEEDGSLLCLDNESVFRCSRKSVKPLNEWTSLSEMLGNEIKRLSALFDEFGRKKDPERPTTPDVS
jgi:hypothetical protein